MRMDVQESVLPNGLRVIVSCLPHVESVSVGLWIGVGGRYEPARLSGVSHFIEHMLFKGTAKRSARRISEAIEGHGGHLNAFTQEENTCFYARAPRDQLRRSLDVLCDMVRHSVFDPVELDRERGVIIEEIMMYRDQPQQLVQERLGEALWKNHPVGRPLIGSPDTLRTMGRKDMLKFMAQSYTAPNIVMALAGNVTLDQAMAEADRFLADVASCAAPSFEPAPSSVPQMKTMFCVKPIEQAHVALGIRLFGRHDKRRFALRVLNVILGENMSSRLFQIVREKHGLAYSIHSHAQLFHDTGAWTVSAGLDRQRLQKAMQLIVREMATLKQKSVGAAELRRAKDYLIGQIKLGWESTGNQMTWLGENLMSLDRFVSPEDIIAALGRVTADELQRLARTVLRPSRVSLAAVLPESLRGAESDLRDAVMAL